MDWLGELWPGLFWFALGLGAMWGFLRILPGRLYRGEFNDLSPVAFYKVPSVDSPEALMGADLPKRESGTVALEDGATEGPSSQGASTPPTTWAHIEDADERRAALIEAIRARERQGE